MFDGVKKSILKKKTILILGSKPNAVIPDSDYTYCANASASYYADEIKNHKNITSIVSASELIIGTRKNSESKDNWIEGRIKRIANLISDELVLYATDNFPGSVEILKKNKCEIPIRSITTIEVYSMVKKITGITIPTITKSHFANNKMLIILLRYIKNYFRLLFLSGNDINGLFRPSTGIISLIYAIAIHGKNAEYIISGISIDKRGNYPDGSKNNWSSKNTLENNHVLVDRKILFLLSENYNLKTTEKSLEKILKIF